MCCIYTSIPTTFALFYTNTLPLHQITLSIRTTAVLFSNRVLHLQIHPLKYQPCRITKSVLQINLQNLCQHLCILFSQIHLALQMSSALQFYLILNFHYLLTVISHSATSDKSATLICSDTRLCQQQHIYTAANTISTTEFLQRRL